MDTTQEQPEDLLTLAGLFVVPLAILILFDLLYIGWETAAAALAGWGGLLAAFLRRTAQPGEAHTPVMDALVWRAPSASQPGSVGPGEERLYTWQLEIPGRLPETMQLTVTLYAEDDLPEDAGPGGRAGAGLPAAEWRGGRVTAASPTLAALVAGFRRLQYKHYQPSLLLACNVLAFVTAAIEQEEENGNAPGDSRLPYQTLAIGRGSQEDQTVLAAALLHRLGFDMFLLQVDEHWAIAISGADQLPGHFFPSPHDQRSFFFGWLVDGRWALGEAPAEGRLRGSEFIPAASPAAK